jgi:HEAT repeat protein
MNNQGTANPAGNALIRMMPNSVPVLTNVLVTGNVTARSAAAGYLSTAFRYRGLEPMARTAIVAAFQDPDRTVRLSAVSAFHYWTAVTPLELVVPELTRALSDPDRNIRGEAAAVLATMGSLAKPAVPELMKLHQDTNMYTSFGGYFVSVSNTVARALKQIDPEELPEE